MRLAITSFALMLFAAVSGLAQTTGLRHPDPAAVYVGSFTVVLELAPSDGTISTGEIEASSTERGVRVRPFGNDKPRAQVINEISVWNTGGGQKQYLIDPYRMKIQGPMAILDPISTAKLFEMLSNAAVLKGNVLGYTTPLANCTGAVVTKVLAPACVSRSTTRSTFIIPSDVIEWGSRDYSICAPNGTPILEIVSKSTSSCGSTSGYDATF